jgi:hypothetical protein
VGEAAELIAVNVIEVPQQPSLSQDVALEGVSGPGGGQSEGGIRYQVSAMG